MTEYKDLTLLEKMEVVAKAHKFIKIYQDHFVKSVAASKDDNAVAPSGSDLFNPALWKPCHWKWYLNLKKEGGI